MKAGLQKFAPLLVMFALLIGGIVIGFAPTLSRDVVFLAPDAPLQPITQSDAWQALFSRQPFQPLTLLTALFGYAFAYEATFWLAMLVMAAGGYLILRGRDLSSTACAFGGLCAGFAGYFCTLFCAGHRGVVDTLSITVLGLGCLMQALRTRHVGWFLGAGGLFALAMPLQPDIWLMLMVLVLASTLFTWVQLGCPWRKLWLKTLLAIAVFAFVAWGTNGFVAVFSGAKATREAQLAQATQQENSPDAQWEFITNWSLPPEDLTDIVLPGSKGWSSYPMEKKRYSGRMGSAAQALRQHSIALPLASLFCVLLALGWATRQKARRAEVAFWTILGVTALVLALGKFTPVYRLITYVPGLSAMRAPVKWMHLVGIASAVLAAIGCEALIRRCGRWVALVLAIAAAVEMTWVIRHFVFAIDLHETALTRVLPKSARIYDAVGWQTFQTICQWHGHALTANPQEATHILTTVRADLPAKPLATQTIQGYTLGIYRIQ